MASSRQEPLAEARALMRKDARSLRPRIEALLDEAEMSPNRRCEARLVRANLHFGLGEYDRALELSDALCAAPKARCVADGHNVRGVVFLERGAWGLALDAFESALASLPPEELLRIGNIRNNLGLLSSRLGELELASEHYREAARVFELLDRPVHAGTVMIHLGAVQAELGRAQEARSLFERSCTLLADMEVERLKAVVGLAALDEADGLVDDAQRRLTEVLAARLRLGHKRGIVEASLGLARVELARGHLDAAQRHLERGTELAGELALLKDEADAVAIRAELLAARGHWEAAYAQRLELERLQAALSRDEIRRRAEAASQRTALQDARRESARRGAEARELRHERDRSEEALQLQKRFLATASHELRGPLAVVVGACGLLTAEELEPRAAELVTLAQRSASMLEHVVTDLLDLSRLDSGIIALHPAPFALAPLARDVVQMGAATRTSERVELRCRLAPDLPPWVHGDENHVRRVLLNLVTNAVKYTEAGHVELRVSAADGSVRFEVQDTGVGIGDAFVPHLFEAFTRESRDVIRRKVGTGLGLSITRRLAIHLGGSLQLERTSPEGSVFSAVLPLPACEPARAAPRRQRTSTRVQRALIVDDDVVMQHLLATMLRALGHQVLGVAAGVSEARAALAHTPPDVVLLDLCLEDGSGLEVASELRASGSSSRVVVISGETDTAAAREAGVDAVLLKPVTLDGLRSALA